MTFFHLDGKSMFKPILIGVIASLLITVILTCLFGLMIQMMPKVPYGAIDYVMIAVEGVSVLSGAYFAGVISRSRGLIIGASCGGIMLLILFAFGLSAANNDISVMTLIKSAVMLLCGIAGGVAGVNRKERLHI